MTDPHDCWGCETEPSIDDGLGAQCRTQLAERRIDPSTPKLNDLIHKLDSVYERLCWNCESDLSKTLAGLCPRCHLELRG